MTRDDRDRILLYAAAMKTLAEASENIATLARIFNALTPGVDVGAHADLRLAGFWSAAVFADVDELKRALRVDDNLNPEFDVGAEAGRKLFPVPISEALVRLAGGES